MAGLAARRNEIFAAKDDPQIGWCEADPSQTFKLRDFVPGLTAEGPSFGIDIKASQSVCSDA